MSEIDYSKFQIGQVWLYDARPGEEGSELCILRIDKFEEQAEPIFHISVRGIKLKNDQLPEGFQTGIDHIPLSASAFVQSVTELFAFTNCLPFYEEAYRDWLIPFSEGQAGIWTLPIKECLEAVESAFQNRA